LRLLLRGRGGLGRRYDAVRQLGRAHYRNDAQRPGDKAERQRADEIGSEQAHMVKP